MRRKSTKAVKSSFRTYKGPGNVRHVQAGARRKARQKWLCDSGDLAVCLDIVLGIERWAKLLVDECHFGNVQMYSVVTCMLLSQHIGMSKRTGCHSHSLEGTFGYIPPIGCGSKPGKTFEV